jgi:hypothetical protein
MAIQRVKPGNAKYQIVLPPMRRAGKPINPDGSPLPTKGGIPKGKPGEGIDLKIPGRWDSPLPVPTKLKDVSKPK